VVAWLAIFTLTCLLELPIYLVPLRRVLPLRWGLLVLLALNLATHPIVWFVLPRIFENQVHYVLIAEAFAVLVEGLLLGALSRWRHWPGWGGLSLIGLAFMANAWSATLGELTGYRLIGWLGLLPPS
jgi:hypothetical protein